MQILNLKSKISNSLSLILYPLSPASGQTLLELLVALTLLIFFLLGVAVLEVYSIRNAQYAQDKSEATRLARQQLERARVIRDSAGISELATCEFSCYINNFLTPVQIIPTGEFVQSLTIAETTSADCPLPPGITITPQPVSYKATAFVSWSQGAEVTPPKEIEISSCITDWR